MGKQEFEFPNKNEAMQIGTWLRTSKRWKKHGERDTIAWRPPRVSRLTRSTFKWLTLFLKANKKSEKEANHGVV